jgi:thiamine-monophosphate kinase
MPTEFEFIQNIKKKYGLKYVGDDCAVLPKDDKTDTVVTADMLVEDIDFRLDWTTPEFLGHKALAVSLSDIAAMGAKPKWAMLSIGVPENLWKSDFLDRFYQGWYRLARRYRVELTGGDISRSPDKLIVDSILGGEVPKGRAILRTGAIEGDAIVVTDHVGGSAAGLRLLKNGRRFGSGTESWEDVLLSIHLQPWPQVGTGLYLQKYGLAHAMVDISDGLASDLQHICVASKTGAKLFAEKIPMNLNLVRLTDSIDEQMELALNGGEDFQLLFTIANEKISELSAGLVGGRDYGVFRVIGEVTANDGIIELIRDGKTEILQPKGFRHF